MSVSKQLQSMTAEKLEEYSRKRLVSQAAVSFDESKSPNLSHILLVPGTGSIKSYLGQFQEFNSMQPLKDHRFNISEAGGLDEAVQMLAGSQTTRYDAVVVNPYAKLQGTGEDEPVHIHEVALSVKKFNINGRGYDQKKKIIRSHLPGQTVVEQADCFTFLRHTYSNTPFFFLYLAKSDIGIREIIALRNNHKEYPLLATLHVFEVKPGNHPKLLRRLASTIRR